jgi:hypothetical protein
MDEATRNEIGILYARIEYPRVVTSILLSRLSEDDIVEVGVAVCEHFVKHKDAALNSTFPDSYLAEFEKYVPAQQADAEKRRQRRVDGGDSETE